MNEHENSKQYETDRDVLAQLSAVRDTGATNMMDRFGVRSVAAQCDFAALVEFIDGMSRNELDQYMTALEEFPEFEREGER